MQISKKEVEHYLKEVKRAVMSGRYRIAPREKNRQLSVDYIFTERMQQEVLLGLTAEDFSEAVQNEHPKFREEILYIFGKDLTLLPRFGDKEETVSLYIKFNKLSDLYLIVISLHKQAYPLNYPFKGNSISEGGSKDE